MARLHIPTAYLPVYAVVLLYFAYAALCYATRHGEYQAVFWYIHGVTHEVGHAVTSFLPETIHVLAGSLFQWLTPIACGVYFYFSPESHAAMMTIGWLGFAILDSAFYMRDAIDHTAILVAPFVSFDENALGDWEILFTQWNCLHKAYAIANVTSAIGYSCVILSAIMLIVAACPRKTEAE